MQRGAGLITVSALKCSTSIWDLIWHFQRLLWNVKLLISDQKGQSQIRTQISDLFCNFKSGRCCIVLCVYCSMVNLRGEWQTYIFWLVPQSFTTHRSALISTPFDHWIIQIIVLELGGVFFLIFSRIFFLFSLPTPRSGVINWKGNDSGRQWLPAQEGEAAAPVGTGRTMGPWDSDVGSRDERLLITGGRNRCSL